jgi:hypothetical protein
MRYSRKEKAQSWDLSQKSNIVRSTPFERSYSIHLFWRSPDVKVVTSWTLMPQTDRSAVAFFKNKQML